MTEQNNDDYPSPEERHWQCLEDFRDLKNVFIERVVNPLVKRITKFFEEKEDDKKGNEK